jgi:O-antigen ligase
MQISRRPPLVTMLRAQNDSQKLLQLADWLTVGIAASIPWSTSATAVFITLWIVSVLPTLRSDVVQREFATAAGGLPVLLWILAVAGVLWADVAWSERISGLGSFHRLLAIPLLLAQFRRSEHGFRVLYGFLAAATCLLVVSWIFALFPGLTPAGKSYGVPVKDYISQSGIFLICAFALLGVACDLWRTNNRRTIVPLVALALLFLANITFVATSRVTLLVAPVLALLLGWRQFGWKGILVACLLASCIAGALWSTSPYLRARVSVSIQEFHAYRDTDDANSTGQHIEFLKKSMAIVEAAPFVGHGTGSISDQFRRTVSGKTGAAAMAPDNPHNQIFAVAIQLGLVGAIVLVAMWIAHFMLFRSGGLTSWIGMIIVAQDILSSLVNSHLFDFGQGWLYVFGVGVAGGMSLRERDAALRSGDLAP